MIVSDNKAGESDPLKREAFEWVVRLTSGAATEADVEALNLWRSQSPAHAAVFAEAVALRRMLRQAALEFTDDLRAVPEAPRSPQRLWSARPRRSRAIGRRAFLGGAIAASAAGVMLVRPPLGLWPSLTELTADYRTGTGERRHVALGDGVSLDMNTQTSIAVRSIAQEPRIELISGEAKVSASVDPAGPLVVVAAGGRMTAARADFNVRHDGGGVCVTCLDGMVEVASLDGATVRLQPRHQVIYTRSGLGPVVPVDPAIVTAWRSGSLIFHDRPLAQVVEEVNRYRPGRIILTDSDLGRLPVNGIFHLDRIDGVIAQFQKLGARVTSLPGGIVLLS
jgi:transmembrane sensor